MTTRTAEWAPPPYRSTALLVIVALHALVIYGFLSVFVPPKPLAPLPPLIGKFIDSDRPTPTKTPEPRGVITTLTGIGPIKPVPLAPINWNPSDFSPIASTAGPDASVGAATTLPLSYVVTRPIDEFYPPGSIRRNEEGSSILQVCVAATGALAAAPTLQGSSGYTRLDTAALKWAKEALRFAPAQRDGRAVPACKGFRVTFKLSMSR